MGGMETRRRRRARVWSQGHDRIQGYPFSFLFFSFLFSRGQLVAQETSKGYDNVVHDTHIHGRKQCTARKFDSSKPEKHTKLSGISGEA
jgi:hypothetical protein